MSFLLGPISGAVIAGGVYYGFSTMIQTRTEAHIHDLHVLSTRLAEPAAPTNAPPSAFDRIQHRPFRLLLQNGWNNQVESLFRDAQGFSTRTIEWSRRKLYGEENTPRKSM
ncbi:uncharacterized protein PHACADRAFT_92257 [Phanerochaete carnosa HHB-10118-sp]|uniref:MICOS complex subunit MIC12 n=1 Tax=Phanerochaete carnosa (strain HHB-10118-sp) TaxID=650164 RepID=K5W0H1_PHACS|nr:uncharacterized protein PHACADRAFT_92257 [Phanerochaete carnosa HHB-10118-sp]EKM57298.1 hypothetical protein PHACADRAFT_92257 [Phanerochaete carnosa HHB-10118-sp]